MNAINAAGKWEPDYTARIILGVLRSVYATQPAIAKRMLDNAQREWSNGS
jgi:hypothetical protein